MNISLLKEKGNKYIIFILLGLLVLIFAIPTNITEDTKKEAVTEYTEAGELEMQLKRVLSAMEGVGEVEVMITTDVTEDSLFGESGAGENVCGVVVVAEGAGQPTVDSRISEAVKALFSIEAHKISIVKMRLQEEDK